MVIELHADISFVGSPVLTCWGLLCLSSSPRREARWPAMSGLEAGGLAHHLRPVQTQNGPLHHNCSTTPASDTSLASPPQPGPRIRQHLGRTSGRVAHRKSFSLSSAPWSIRIRAFPLQPIRQCGALDPAASSPGHSNTCRRIPARTRVDRGQDPLLTPSDSWAGIDSSHAPCPSPSPPPPRRPMYRCSHRASLSRPLTTHHSPAPASTHTRPHNAR